MKDKKQSISKDDIIFKFCSVDDNIPDSQISYYGWECGDTTQAFNNYICGYKVSAEVTYQKFLESGKQEKIDIQDTICFPLIFLYRHIVELYLKYLYILLIRPSEEERNKFIKNGHDLTKLWDGMSKDMIDLATRAGSDLDINVIEHYVGCIADEDPQSMLYRYPITNKGKKSHNNWKYLDVVNLHSKMNLFFDYLDSVASNLSKQLDKDKFDESFNRKVDNVLSLSKDKIMELFEFIENRENAQGIPDKKWLSMSDIPNKTPEERDKEYQFAGTFSKEQKTLLILLYFTGGSLNDFDISNNRKDVYRLLLSQYNANIDFSESSKYKDDFFRHYMFGCKTTKAYISKTLDLLGFKL